MPICHRVLLGKLSQQTTSGLRSVGGDVSAMTSNGSSWKGDNSSVTLTKLLNVTLHNSLPLVNISGNGTGDGVGPLGKVATNNSLFIKIVLLLILTAVVLLSTYKFVVRLFSGYSEKKDDSSEFYIGMHDD